MSLAVGAQGLVPRGTEVQLIQRLWRMLYYVVLGFGRDAARGAAVAEGSDHVLGAVEAQEGDGDGVWH